MRDQEAEQAKLIGLHFEERQLIAEVFLQRLRAGRHILHGVVLLVALLVHAVARRAMLFVELVFPVFAQSFEAVEVDAIVAGVVDNQLFFTLVVFGRLDGGSGLGFFFTGGLVVGSLFQLQDRVFLQLLLNPFLQRHNGKLQNLHRLDHAGSQDHPLVHPLRHGSVESHIRGSP